MVPAKFEELNDYELLTVTGGSPSIVVKFFTALGGAVANTINGFVAGCESMADTCYNAGYQLGNYIRQY